MKKERGITLIALIVSIIIMLILVAVTITLVAQGGLIDKALQAKRYTKLAVQNDTNMANQVAIDIDLAVTEEIEPVPMNKNEEGEYEVTVAGNLLWLAEQVNSGNLAPGEGEDGPSIILLNDIDYGNNLFIPIGCYTETEEGGIDINTMFQGTFNGNGKTISGLNIDGIQSQVLHAGFFGVIYNSNITNLTISDSTIKGIQAGALIGAASYSNINNCDSLDNLIQGQTVIDNQPIIGGIVGILASNCLIENCNNTSQVISTLGGIAAGIVGWSIDLFTGGEGNSIIGCTNSGTITCNITACGIIGQFIYQNTPTKTDTIENCTNSGDITGGESGYAAGITIITINPTNIIINCNNSGQITAGTTGNIYYYFH